MAMTQEQKDAEITRLTTALTANRTAQAKAELAASYSISGRSHSNQNIEALQKREQWLMSRLARLRSSGPLVLANTNTEGQY